MSHPHGSTIDVHAPRAPYHHGSYGRLCPDLAPWTVIGVAEHELDAYLLDVANTRMIERPGLLPSDIAGCADLTEELDQAFGSDTPAGYTYFTQFVDHDVTFDPTSSLMRLNDPRAATSFRTPRLDLDNVYGRGPHESPYLFNQNDRGKLLIGAIAGTRLRDLPRNAQGRALIGDMRNDENAMVSQLQLAFLLAHNTLVDRARQKGMADAFESARTSLRWLYQWVVWNDFLKRVTLDEVRSAALQLTTKPGGRKVWELGLDDIYSWTQQPFIPVEFAVAAYRFGHAMVRNSYQTNQPHRGVRSFAPIFDNSGRRDPDDLRGFRPLCKENTLQWDWFLPMTSSSGAFPQTARRIDTRLANALAFRHDAEPGNPMNVLAFRTLKRGFAFGLPSGTDMAHKYCMTPLVLDEGEPDALWYYLLREAENGGGQTLGRLGSSIVCATFAGLLKGDPHAYLNMWPCWTPDQDDLLCPGKDNIDDPSWTLASIIRLAGLPVSGDDVAEQTGNGGDTPGGY